MTVAREDGRPAPSTILDVAAAAGVSRQTVTRAMNDMPGINPATRERVLEAAARLAYRPSRHARGLVKGGTRQLGLVVNDLTNPYSPELAAAVVRRAARSGWNVMLADVSLAGDPEAAVRALAGQVDAVVGYFGDEWIPLLAGLPVVLLDPPGERWTSAVVIDPAAAIEQLADHLVETGVRHPAVLDSSDPGERSLRGDLMVRALERRGYLPVLEHAEASAASAAEHTERLLGRGRRLDAILAFNDLMALGALDACRRAGVSVPGDVRITGVDGLPLGTYVTPTLTTLAVDRELVAEHALDLVFALTGPGERPTGEDAVRRVENTLLLRESA
jgi:DNA-binding LacI/PurR family transcriptional regulator